MGKDKKDFRAFSVNYNEIVPELMTAAAIKPPRVLVGDNDSLWININAIWDTGATNTVITNKMALRLNLKPTGKAIVFGVNSQAVVNRYIIDIEFSNKIIFPNFEVTESNLNTPDVDLLVGMDIIQQGDFLISNANGETTFSFCKPSLKNQIDLMEISKKLI